MFRNVMNSLSDRRATANDRLSDRVSLNSNTNHQQEDSNSTGTSKFSSDISETNNNQKAISSSSNSKHTRLSMKAGRKKLSSVMSRLRLSSSATNGGKTCVKGAEGTNDDKASDVSDDDDAYTSAEEACRKMSAGGESLASRKHSIATIKTTTTTTTTSASYEQLKGDKKYVLPEEECDIPTFLATKNCPQHLIQETRRLLKERYAKSPEAFYDADYARMLTDDWTVSRFLLRRRLDPKRTAKLMEECGRFRKQYKMSEVALWEFPWEFHKAGGLFKYAPDRVGNVTMYMRIKMYRRVPEISDVFKAWILCVLEQCDVANNGRGTAVVFDLSGCGLQNVDLGFLSWLLSSFRNYCPKGVSYIIVYNLPWILNATCKLAMTWMSASNKRALRFVYGDEIENFIERSNLPDYLGGECKLNYRAIPAGSRPAIEICDRLDMTREQAIKIRELFKEYLDNDDDDELEILRKEEEEEEEDETKSHYDDAKSDELASTDLMTQASKFIAH